MENAEGSCPAAVSALSCSRKRGNKPIFVLLNLHFSFQSPSPSEEIRSLFPTISNPARMPHFSVTSAFLLQTAQHADPTFLLAPTDSPFHRECCRAGRAARPPDISDTALLWQGSPKFHKLPFGYLHYSDRKVTCQEHLLFSCSYSKLQLNSVYDASRFMIASLYCVFFAEPSEDASAAVSVLSTAVTAPYTLPLASA